MYMMDIKHTTFRFVMAVKDRNKVTNMKTQKRKTNYIRVVAIISIAAVILLAALATSQKLMPISRQNSTILITNSPTNTPVNPTEGRFIPLTPTVFPASQPGWLTFVYPDPNKKYTFEYPAMWKLDVEKNTSSDSIKVSVIDPIDKSTTFGYIGIAFQQNPPGIDYPGYDYLKTEKHVYESRSATEDTLYKSDKPFESDILFDNYYNEVKKDALNYIRITYPDTNIEQYRQTVDQILTSLKFYY